MLENKKYIFINSEFDITSIMTRSLSRDTLSSRVPIYGANLSPLHTRQICKAPGANTHRVHSNYTGYVSFSLYSRGSPRPSVSGRRRPPPCIRALSPNVAAEPISATSVLLRWEGDNHYDHYRRPGLSGRNTFLVHNLSLSLSLTQHTHVPCTPVTFSLSVSLSLTYSKLISISFHCAILIERQVYF